MKGDHKGKGERGEAPKGNGKGESRARGGGKGPEGGGFKCGGPRSLRSKWRAGVQTLTATIFLPHKCMSIAGPRTLEMQTVAIAVPNPITLCSSQVGSHAASFVAW